jgi:hypothetical protein
MSHSDCLNCEARFGGVPYSACSQQPTNVNTYVCRNKKCDRTQGATGCRRCAQVGIECEGYPSTRTSKPRHNFRGVEVHTRVSSRPTIAYEDHSLFPDLAINTSEPTEATVSININELSGNKRYLGTAALDTASRLTERSSVISVNQETNYGFCHPWQSDYLEIVQHRNKHSAVYGDSSVIGPQQTPGRLIESHFDEPAPPSLAKLLEAGFDLRLQENVPHSSSQRLGTNLGWSTDSKVVPTHCRLPVNLNHRLDLPDNAEISPRGVIKELVLDRRVDSNALPFVIHSCEPASSSS